MSENKSRQLVIMTLGAMALIIGGALLFVCLCAMAYSLLSLGRAPASTPTPFPTHTPIPTLPPTPTNTPTPEPVSLSMVTGYNASDGYIDPIIEDVFSGNLLITFHRGTSRITNWPCLLNCEVLYGGIFTFNSPGSETADYVEVFQDEIYIYEGSQHTYSIIVTYANQEDTLFSTDYYVALVVKIVD